MNKKNNKVVFGIIEIVGIFLICLGILLLLIFSRKKLNEKTIEDVSLYTYLGTEKIDINGTIKFDYANETATIENSTGKNIIISSVPLYYNNEQQLILPRNMSYVNFYSAKQVKVPNFTKISYKNSDFYFSLNDKEEKIYNSFLFDGDDLYLFFNDVILKYDNFDIHLSPLSYVSYNYNKDLYVYDYGIKELYHYENVSDAYVLYDENKINLKSDSIDSESNSKILIKNINSLKKIQMEW